VNSFESYYGNNPLEMTKFRKLEINMIFSPQKPALYYIQIFKELK